MPVPRTYVDMVVRVKKSMANQSARANQTSKDGSVKILVRIFLIITYRNITFYINLKHEVFLKYADNFGRDRFFWGGCISPLNINVRV